MRNRFAKRSMPPGGIAAAPPEVADWRVFEPVGGIEPRWVAYGTTARPASYDRRKLADKWHSWGSVIRRTHEHRPAQSGARELHPHGQGGGLACCCYISAATRKSRWWESNPRSRHGVPVCHHNTSPAAVCLECPRGHLTVVGALGRASRVDERIVGRAGIEPASGQIKNLLQSQRLLPTQLPRQARRVSSHPLESNQDLSGFSQARRPHAPGWGCAVAADRWGAGDDDLPKWAPALPGAPSFVSSVVRDPPRASVGPCGQTSSGAAPFHGRSSTGPRIRTWICTVQSRPSCRVGPARCVSVSASIASPMTDNDRSGAPRF